MCCAPFTLGRAWMHTYESKTKGAEVKEKGQSLSHRLPTKSATVLGVRTASRAIAPYASRRA